MADITKRATRKLAAHLETGEQPEVALLAEPAGTYGVTGLAAAALPRTTGRHLRDKAAARNAAAGGIAAMLPAEPVALVVTGHRVLVVPTNGLRWRDPALTLPRGQVKVTVTAARAFGRRLRFAFTDGSAAEVDIQRGQPLMRFIAAVGTVDETGDPAVDGSPQSLP